MHGCMTDLQYHMLGTSVVPQREMRVDGVRHQQQLLLCATRPIVNLTAAPMTRTAGYLTLPAGARGGTVMVVTKPDPAGLLDAIEEHRVTEFFLPPTVIYRLLEMPGIRQRDFSLRLPSWTNAGAHKRRRHPLG